MSRVPVHTGGGGGGRGCRGCSCEVCSSEGVWRCVQDPGRGGRRWRDVVACSMGKKGPSPTSTGSRVVWRGGGCSRLTYGLPSSTCRGGLQPAGAVTFDLWHGRGAGTQGDRCSRRVFGPQALWQASRAGPIVVLLSVEGGPQPLRRCSQGARVVYTMHRMYFRHAHSKDPQRWRGSPPRGTSCPMAGQALSKFAFVALDL